MQKVYKLDLFCAIYDFLSWYQSQTLIIRHRVDETPVRSSHSVKGEALDFSVFVSVTGIDSSVCPVAGKLQERGVPNQSPFGLSSSRPFVPDAERRKTAFDALQTSSCPSSETARPSCSLSAAGCGELVFLTAKTTQAQRRLRLKTPNGRNGVEPDSAEAASNALCKTNSTPAALCAAEMKVDGFLSVAVVEEAAVRRGRRNPWLGFREREVGLSVRRETTKEKMREKKQERLTKRNDAELMNVQEKPTNLAPIRSKDFKKKSDGKFKCNFAGTQRTQGTIVKCYRCGKPEHIKKNCRSKFPNKKDNKSQNNKNNGKDLEDYNKEVICVVSECLFADGDLTGWWVDSRVTRHIAKQKKT
ncbi:hypothetical protein EJ110_NYTH37601 [Nymphaea thermarum]|nr:hypothetical protein EJ110_NYTH37601 [Nymphaea thermarum]